MNKNNNPQKNNKIVRKPGRTILVKSTDPVPTENLKGLLSSVKTNNDNNFLVFDTVENSKEAFKTLRQNNDIKIKYAHYRIFFTMSGLDDTTDYTTLKKSHIDWIKEKSNADVLYYKQYKKENKYLGCGDFTIDTKESLDKLLSKTDLKTYSFEKFSGIFYRYNNKKHETKPEDTHE